MKISALLRLAKLKLRKLFCKSTYYDLWHEDILGIGSVFHDDGLRAEDSKKTRTGRKKATDKSQ